MNFDFKGDKDVTRPITSTKGKQKNCELIIFWGQLSSTLKYTERQEGLGW